MCERLRTVDFDFCGYAFSLAGRIRPALLPSGEIFIYYPHQCDRYQNEENYQIMTLNGETIGDRGFCFFVIDNGTPTNENDNLNTATIANLPRRQGVYIWVCENQVIYVGRATNDGRNSLYSRFKSGYGRISPRNCYRSERSSGQLTNLKMNRVVIDYYNENKRIDLYYYECPNSKDVEAQLIDRNWQRKEENRAMQYNSRHERIPINR